MARGLREIEERHRVALRSEGSDVRALPEHLAADLEQLCLDLADYLVRLGARFAGDTLASLFSADELAGVTRQLKQRVVLLDGTGRPMQVSDGDLTMTALTSVGAGMVAGNLAHMGISALLGGHLAAAGGAVAALPILAPVALGGLAVTAMIKMRTRRVLQSEATAWLQRTLSDVRGELTSTAVGRLNDVQTAITLALEDVLDERLAELAEQIAHIDKDRKQALAEPAALRSHSAALPRTLTQIEHLAGLLRATPAARSAPDSPLPTATTVRSAT